MFPMKKKAFDQVAIPIMIFFLWSRPWYNQQMASYLHNNHIITISVGISCQKNQQWSCSAHCWVNPIVDFSLPAAWTAPSIMKINQQKGSVQIRYNLIFLYSEIYILLSAIRCCRQTCRTVKSNKKQFLGFFWRL